jgi:hypothetical protein
MALTTFLESKSEKETRDESGETTIWTRQGGRVLRGEEAQKLADTPILTGDPDYDRWELEETQGEALPAHFFTGSNARAETHNDP